MADPFVFKSNFEFKARFRVGEHARGRKRPLRVEWQTLSFSNSNFEFKARFRVGEACPGKAFEFVRNHLQRQQHAAKCRLPVSSLTSSLPSLCPRVVSIVVLKLAHRTHAVAQPRRHCGDQREAGRPIPDRGRLGAPKAATAWGAAVDLDCLVHGFGNRTGRGLAPSLRCARGPGASRCGCAVPDSLKHRQRALRARNRDGKQFDALHVNQTFTAAAIGGT
jgi:hypothetical protein